MSQNFSVPAALDKASVALQTKVPGSLDALLTIHSGSSEPANPAAYMLWCDTGVSPVVVRQRNGANNAWLVRWTVEANSRQHIGQVSWGDLSASKTAFAGMSMRTATVKRIVILCGAATTSTPGNEWAFQLKKYPNAAPGSPVDLFASPPGTDGAEMVADQAYVLTPDQNATLADLDSLELVVTATGTVTTLLDFRAFIEIE